MIKVIINNTGVYDFPNTYTLLQDYLCCENFDEEVVTYGNDRLCEYKEASWYKKAVEVLTDIDCFDKYPENASIDTIVKLKTLYEGCRRIEDIIPDVVELLYPDCTFKTGTLTGYSQGEWQKYIVKEDVDTDLLEALYFGKVREIEVESPSEEFHDVVTDDELWKNEKDLKQYFRRRYDFKEDEEIHIFSAETVQTIQLIEVR